MKKRLRLLLAITALCSLMGFAACQLPFPLNPSGPANESSAQSSEEISSQSSDSSEEISSTEESSSEESSESGPVQTFYMMEYYLEQEDGTYVLQGDATEVIIDHTKKKPVMSGDEVSCYEKVFNGYAYDATNANNVQTATVEADGVTLKRYYKLVTATEAETENVSWNTVSEDRMQAYARYYLNTPKNGYSLFTSVPYEKSEDGIAWESKSPLSVDTLSAKNAVGGRTEGEYYRVQPQAFGTDTSSWNQLHHFSLLPLLDKEAYETKYSENASLKFDVYLTFEGAEDGETREYRLHGDTGYSEIALNEWKTVEVYMSDLFANWNAFTNPGSLTDKNVTAQTAALFTLNGTKTGIAATQPTFWIGNFRVEEYVEEPETEWTWNNITKRKPGVIYITNGSEHSDWGNVQYVESYEGRSDVYKITATNHQIQFHGIAITAKHEKSYYEMILSVDPNATLEIDVYWDLDGMCTGANLLQTNDTYNYGLDIYPDKQWNTISMSFAKLIENWDLLGCAGEEQAQAGGIICLGGGERATMHDWSFYVTNVKINTTAEYISA
ncbi:MAG: hypothetical protein IJV85_00360 [Clostridia bacterium]|nr:hypothetical protein [Clostridia bacterium]